MRVCLTTALAFTAVAGNPYPDPPAATPGAARSMAFHAPEVVLDGSKYGWMRQDYPAEMFPAFADVDRDGKTDLVVGVTDWNAQPGGGRLLVFRNEGTKARPQYTRPT
jgi:hypothetical protein